MKSKRRKRVIASVLCMVLMLSTGMSTLAEADAGTVPAVEETTAAQTTAQETKSTSTDAQTAETETQTQTETENRTETKQTEEAAQTKQEETTAAQPTEEASGRETTQTEQTTAENAKAVQTQENNQNTAQDTQTTTSQQNVAESEENLTEKDSTAASGSSEKEEASVLNTAMQLKKEWKDAEGTVKERVTANIPEGAFQAENSDITMTVKKVTGDRSTEIQELMKDRLPENSYLGEFFLYDIQFEVAGEKVEPQKAITFTFEGNDITADDSKRVNVFYMDPSDSRKLVEITQKSEMLETLKNQGKSTANIDDYDLSEVSIKDGKIESATAEGKLATVYGCYVEAFSKEVVLTKTVDGTTVKLTAPEGAFPMDSEKVQMEVKALTEEQEKVIEEKLEEQKVEDYVAFDINLLADGKTIQPQIPVKVTFENAGLDVKKSNSTVGFQVDGKEQTLNVLETTETNETITLQAEHFTVTGVYTYEKSIDNMGTASTQSDSSLPYESIAEDYTANSAKATNQWQIVSGKYAGHEDDEYELTDNGYFRLQKKVIPTNTENEFYIYLNMEPVMSWEEVFLRSTMWICGNNWQGDVSGITKNMTASEVKEILGGQVSKLVSKEVSLNDEISTQPNKEVDVNKIVIQITEGKTVEIPVRMHYGLSQQSEDSFTIIYGAPDSDKFVKLSNVQYNQGILTIPQEAWGQIVSGSEIGDFLLLTGKVQPDQVKDVMGEYILYEGEEECSNGKVEDSQEGTLIWKNFEELEATDNSDAYVLYKGNYYRKNAYQMVYRIRLDVQKNDFQSCADEIWEKKENDNTHYKTNQSTKITYHVIDGSEDSGPLYADFTSPEVRGLLYDLEFRKVDQNSAPVKSAEFTLTGKYYDKEISKVETSDEEGYIKFRDLPCGIYRLEETDTPDGYSSDYNGESVTLCYTTNSSELTQDHSDRHEADEEGDIDNALNGKVGEEGNGIIVKTSDKITPGPDPGYDTKPDVPYKKQIDWLGDKGNNKDTTLTGDYFYRLYLDVTGIPDTQGEGADIVFVLDMSTSMKFYMENQNDSTAPVEKQRLAYVKSAATKAIETIQNTCKAQGVDNINIGLVTFNYGNALHETKYENGTQILSEFTNNYNQLISTVEGLEEKDLNNRTNYEAAFAATEELLKTAKQENKYVVFITDGETNGYTEGGDGFDGNDKNAEGIEKYTNPENTDQGGNEESIKQAQAIAKDWTELAGFYTIAVSKDVESSVLRDRLGPSGVSRMDLQADNENAVEDAFHMVISAITKQICDVTIQDQLSEYVEFANEEGKTLSEQDITQDGLQGDNIALRVTKTTKSGESVVSEDDYTVTIEPEKKIIRVNFGENYFLEPDATYTISFNVKLTDQVFTDGMDDTGDEGTDYGDNMTSSCRTGHFSNKEATVSYSTVTLGKFIKYTDEYDKPVVQAQEKPNWQLIKESKTDSEIRLEGAEFVLKQGNQILYRGSSIADNLDTQDENEKGYIEWTDDKTEELIEENQIPAGIYTLEEIKAPTGYSLSNVTWQVTIKNMEEPEIIPIDSDGEKGSPLSASKNDDTDTFVFVITNTPVYSLPSSGGQGIYWYTISGALLLMAGTLILYNLKKGEVLKK